MCRIEFRGPVNPLTKGELKWPSYTKFAAGGGGNAPIEDLSPPPPRTPPTLRS